MRYRELMRVKALEYAVMLGDVVTIKQTIEEVSNNAVEALRLRALYRTDPDAFVAEVRKKLTGRRRGTGICKRGTGQR